MVQGFYDIFHAQVGARSLAGTALQFSLNCEGGAGGLLAMMTLIQLSQGLLSVREI
jgi:hypothetical protein